MSNKTDFHKILNRINEDGASDYQIIRLMQEMEPTWDIKDSYRSTLTRIRRGDVKQPEYDLGRLIMQIYLDRFGHG